MNKLIIKVILALNLTIFAGIVYFHYMASWHHEKAAEMFKFAGTTYRSPDNELEILYDNPIQGYAAELYRPLSSAVSPFLFNKEYMRSSGLKDDCGSVEYLKLLRNDIDSTVYAKSHLCCMPNIMNDLLPMVLDQKEDRALVMCGFSGDAHVISFSVDDFNKLLNVNMTSGQSIDIRKSEWK